MTVGNLLFYGGIAGVVISMLLLFACIRAFPKKRKKKLESYDGTL